MAGRRQTAGMELAIGATMLAAVIILLVMLFSWGSGASVFTKQYWVVVVMNNVGGLRAGAPVKIGGYQIGKVASIQLRPGATDLEIVLGIEESRLLPRGSTGKISTAGIVGDAFMEIIPGRSTETIKRADNVAEAERIESSPVPDFSELLVRVEALGNQLNGIAANVNDILSDEDFRKNIKTIASNLVTVTDEATTMLQRGQRVVDNIERATQNVAVLSGTLKDRVDVATDDILRLTNTVNSIADDTKLGINDLITRTQGIAETLGSVADKANGTMDNLDGGITDIRRAVNGILGDPQVIANVKATVGNIRGLSDTMAAKRGDVDEIIANVKALSGDLSDSGGKVRAVLAGIEPEKVAATVDSVSGAIQGVTELIELVKREPVLALSVNKAADRIVKAKFDEMGKNQTRSSDQMLQEINRWVREGINRGYMLDPSYPHDRRPYVVEYTTKP